MTSQLIPTLYISITTERQEITITDDAVKPPSIFFMGGNCFFNDLRFKISDLRFNYYFAIIIATINKYKNGEK